MYRWVSLMTMSFKSTSWIFWLFVGLHALAWTLLPTYFHPSVTHDTLEGITWGMNWQLGYNKHPFLTAWLCAGVTKLFGTVGWPVFLLAQLAVSLTFFAVWQLAKEMLPSKQALIAALSIEGVLFYNITSYNITPDTLQSPLWALAALVLYKAIKTQYNLYWIASGVLAALCFCTKYQAVLLYIPLVFFCAYHSSARQSFKQPGPYLALISFLLLFSPHVFWLIKNNYISIRYAFSAPSEYTPNQTLFGHLRYPLLFLGNNLVAVSGLFLLFWPFYTPEHSKRKGLDDLVLEGSGEAGANKEQQSIPGFDLDFLLTVVCGPFLLTFILCVITGDYFALRWSTPYYFGLGILLMLVLQTRVTPKRFCYFLWTLLCFSLLLLVGKIINLTYIPNPKNDAFLPNRHIAQSLTALWRERYHSPLPFLAGSSYLVSSVAPYCTDAPKTYLNWNRSLSPWINEAELRRKGAIFIWDLGVNYNWDRNSILETRINPRLKARFPELIATPNRIFYKLHNKQAVLIGIGILPPSSTRKKALFHK